MIVELQETTPPKLLKELQSQLLAKHVDSRYKERILEIQWGSCS